jgi:hypothetical protein
MSQSSSDFISGYGLRDEILEQIVEQENLRDIASRFSRRIDEISNKFDTEARIGIL